MPHLAVREDPAVVYLRFTSLVLNALPFRVSL